MGVVGAALRGFGKALRKGKPKKVGDTIKAKVIKVDTSRKKIALSIKAFEDNLDLAAIEREQAQLENLKEQLNPYH